MKTYSSMPLVTLAITASAWGFSVSLASAAILMDPTTNNGSFESAPNGNDPSWTAAGSETGWTLTAGDPNRTYHRNVAPQQGANHQLIEKSGSVITSAVFGTVQANTDYTISGWSAQNGVKYDLRANGVSIAAALAAGIAPGSDVGPESGGTWTQFSATVTAAALLGNIGQNLDVVVTYVSQTGSTWADVDNVVVTSALVPEPTSAVALVVAFGLGIARRRKI